MSDRVLVTVVGDTAFVKIEGKGTYSVAPELKKFCFDQISRGVCNIILDMNECGTMDSTFMGVMAGVAMRLRDLSEHSFLVINLTQKTKELLEVLGLTNLLDCYLTEEVSEELAKVDDFDEGEELSFDKDKATTAKVMLKAHQDLVRADENNQSKFKNVINYLSSEVDS